MSYLTPYALEPPALARPLRGRSAGRRRGDGLGPPVAPTAPCGCSTRGRRSGRSTHTIDARLVVIGLVSNGFSIADPRDQGTLDVVGFGLATRQLISDFARGSL